MKREVKPELLDTLPAHDQAAILLRADLRRLNRLLGHASILGKLLDKATNGRPPGQLIELGAGDGTAMLLLAKTYARRWPGMPVTLVDKTEVVSTHTRKAFSALGWNLTVVEADAYDWLQSSRAPSAVILCNLFLHHFSDPQLKQLMGLAATCAPVFLATEPRRARLPHFASHLAGCIGCGPVTRHDIVVSIQAGFSGNELSALWPEDSGWTLQEKAARIFTHTFSAVRHRALTSEAP